MSGMTRMKASRQKDWSTSLSVERKENPSVSDTFAPLGISQSRDKLSLPIRIPLSYSCHVHTAAVLKPPLQAFIDAGKKAHFVKNQLLAFGVFNVMSSHGHWMHRRSVVDFRRTVLFFRCLLFNIGRPRQIAFPGGAPAAAAEALRLPPPN